jgi:hypothetical protein
MEEQLLFDEDTDIDVFCTCLNGEVQLHPHLLDEENRFVEKQLLFISLGTAAKIFPSVF